MNQQELDKLRALISQGASAEDLNAWLDRQYWLLWGVMPGSQEDKPSIQQG